MTKFTDEVLMVEARMKEAAKRPKIGEVIQAIFFAFYNAKNNFEAANLLFEKYPTAAFAIYVGGMEEIGKINKLANAFIDWKSLEKLKEFENKKANHTWKLNSSLELLKYLISLSDIKLDTKGEVEEGNFKKDFFNFLVSQFNPQLAKQVHKLRLELMYTDIEDGIAHSPYHSIGQINLKNLKIIVPVLVKMIDLMFQIFKKIAPNFFGLLEKCYFAAKNEEIELLKAEINRQASRIMPAFRKHCCEIQMNQVGVFGDEWFEKFLNAGPDVKFDYRVEKNDFQKVLNLISGNQHIEKIYFYPPLRESAKEHYRSLSANEMS